RRRHTSFSRDWSSDVCSSDLTQVIRRRPMTALAGNTRRVPLAVETVFYRVIAGLVAGGVALNALGIGVVGGLTPVQRVMAIHALAVVAVKPLLLFRIPGHARCLQAAVIQRQQVLLQGRPAEGISQGKFPLLPKAVGCTHAVFTRVLRNLLLHKMRSFRVAGEEGVVEVAEHGVWCRSQHGQLMVRALPVFNLWKMALAALRFVYQVGPCCHPLSR